MEKISVILLLLLNLAWANAPLEGEAAEYFAFLASYLQEEVTKIPCPETEAQTYCLQSPVHGHGVLILSQAKHPLRLYAVSRIHPNARGVQCPTAFS
jgi:hypothetical protein